MNDETALLSVRDSGGPKYQRVSRLLKKRIKTLKSGEILPSISEIARQMNINYRTAKSALLELKSEGIINYEPNKAAVVCHSKKTIRIGYIRWRGDDYCLEYQKGIEKFAEEIGENLHISVVDSRCSHTQQVEAVAHAGELFDGILVHPFDLPEYRQALEKTIKSGVKIVYLDRELADVPGIMVSADHYGGAIQATKHLLESHGEAVYYIGETKGSTAISDRLEGWIKALSNYGYTNFEDYIFPIDISEDEASVLRDSGSSVTAKKLESFFENNKKDKYSFFACNDYIARGVYLAAKTAKKEIGHDVFVVGFGDSPFCKKFKIPMSSVAQYSSDVGYLAGKILYETCSNGNDTRQTRHYVSVELKIRDSSLKKS
jgi:LacI family transcriptional regulator